MKVTVDQAFWDLFPTASITVMSLYGIDNTVDEAKDPYFKELLDKGAKRAWEFIDEENYTQSEFVQEWRQAFSKFKTKKGARSSIEALLKRVHQGREFYPINPLVDLYNSVSMAYALPCGGEDMDKLVGGLSLGQAKGGEPFFPLGAEEDSPALEGEICHFDNDGAVCRCLNWREAQRTMLQEETTNAVLIMESVTKDQAERATVAMEALKKRCEEYFNVTGVSSIVTPENSEVEL